MNNGAGGGTAEARADAPAAAQAPERGAACKGSVTNSMNSGAGGGTAEARADAPAAAQVPERGAACENSDTNSMNSGAGGGTAGLDGADAPTAALVPPPAALVRTMGQASKGRRIVRSGEARFRRRAPGSSGGLGDEAHRLAAEVEHAGGGTVMLAIAAAKRAGQDWRATALAARRRSADAAERRCGGFGPLRGPGPGVGPVADVARWDGLAGGA
jgi:hypothetical protein